MAEADQDSEVILFEHPWFEGKHKHVFEQVKDLNAGLDKSFAGLTSSIVVKGTKSWLFYPKQDFGGTAPDDGWEVKPGRWGTNELANRKLKDNKVQSLKPSSPPS